MELLDTDAELLAVCRNERLATGVADTIGVPDEQELPETEEEGLLAPVTEPTELPDA